LPSTGVNVQKLIVAFNFISGVVVDHRKFNVDERLSKDAVGGTNELDPTNAREILARPFG
jgi:hypothetical protein